MFATACPPWWGESVLRRIGGQTSEVGC